MGNKEKANKKAKKIKTLKVKAKPKPEQRKLKSNLSLFSTKMSNIILDAEPPKDVKPLIESSTWRSYQEYLKIGIEEKDFVRAADRPVTEQYKREMDFFSKVNLDKGPLKRKITKMIRQKVDGQEYLTFTENWTASDWVGRPVNPVTDRTEGILHYPKMDIVLDEQGQRIGRKRNGMVTKYEIPFSKEAVDKWLEETHTPKDELKYTVKQPGGNRRCEGNYDQFLYPWNQAIDAMMQDGGFEADYVEGLKKKTTKA